MSPDYKKIVFDWVQEIRTPDKQTDIGQYLITEDNLFDLLQRMMY